MDVRRRTEIHRPSSSRDERDVPFCNHSAIASTGIIGGELADAINGQAPVVEHFARSPLSSEVGFFGHAVAEVSGIESADRATSFSRGFSCDTQR